MMTPPLDYDRLAAEYARHRRIHPGVLRQLIEIGEVAPPTRVVEIGSGSGNYAVALQEATGCEMTGVEPSGAMRAEAEARHSLVSWLEGRAEHLPLPDKSTDLIFSVDVIHHIGDRPAFFREAHRVLGPGGRICTVTDSEDDIARRRPLSSHFPETVPFELRRYPAIETLEAEMAAAGFTEIGTTHVELEYALADLQPYRDRAYSSLHLITEDAVASGIRRLEAALERGPVMGRSLYTLVWGRVEMPRLLTLPPRMR